MDMRDLHYVLVRDFRQDWVIHRDFAIGTFVDDPRAPRRWMVPSKKISITSKMKVDYEAPFTDGRIELSASDTKRVGKLPSQHYVETKLGGSLRSSDMRKREFDIPKHHISELRMEDFVDRLRKDEDAAEFFGLYNSTLDLPLYMVTGIKYAKGLKYRLKWTEDTYFSDEYVSAHPITDQDHDEVVPYKPLATHSGSIPDKDVVIAYKIHKITEDQVSENIRFDVYVDKRGATKEYQAIGWKSSSREKSGSADSVSSQF